MNQIYLNLIWINLRNKAENAGEHVEKLEPLYIAGRNVKCYSCCEKQYDGSSKKLRVMANLMCQLDKTPRELVNLFSGCVCEGISGRDEHLNRWPQ